MRGRFFKAATSSFANVGPQKPGSMAFVKNDRGEGGGLMMKAVGCCGKFVNAFYVH